MTKQLSGASITMPHKISILPHLDVLHPSAHAVGACNTIFIRHSPGTEARLLIGTNTDIIGIREAFYQNSPSQTFRGKPAVIVGGGGAARSAAYALRKCLHATQLYVVNRDPGEAQALVDSCRQKGYGEGMRHVRTLDEARELLGEEEAAPPGAVVACVPDLEPRSVEERRAREILMAFLHWPAAKGAVLEMCYHPRPWTRIAEMAHKAGWQVILGTEALIYQGLEQDRYWTGRRMEELPVKRVREVIAAKLALDKARL